MTKMASQLERLQKDLTDVKVGVAKIEEHLRTLNGTVARHEADLTHNRADHEKMISITTDNRISLAKLGMVSGLGGSGAGIIVYVLIELGKKGLGG